MRVGVRVGMLYILGRARRVEMAMVNTFQAIRYLCMDGSAYSFNQSGMITYITFSLKVMAFLRYFPIIDMFPLGHNAFKCRCTCKQRIPDKRTKEVADVKACFFNSPFDRCKRSTGIHRNTS